MHKLRVGIAILVAVAWATSFTADLIVSNYDPPAIVHAAFMLVLGALFGRQLVKGNGNGGNNK